MTFSPDQALAMAVILTAIEDYYMTAVPINGNSSEEIIAESEQVEINRKSAETFFFGSRDESLYYLYAEHLGVPRLPPHKIADNIKNSGRRMGGKIKKRSMINIIGEW